MGRNMRKQMSLNIIVCCFSFVQFIWGQSKPLRLTQLDHTSWTTKDGAPLNIRKMVQGSDGTMWFAAGIGLYNFNGLTFAPFQFQQIDLQVPSSLFKDRAGDLWVGFGIRGIAVIRNHTVIGTYGESDGLPVGTVRSISQSPDGTILAVARGQLVELRAGRWQHSPAAAALGPDVHDIFLTAKEHYGQQPGLSYGSLLPATMTFKASAPQANSVRTSLKLQMGAYGRKTSLPIQSKVLRVESLAVI